jgi:hypothetical protein
MIVHIVSQSDSGRSLRFIPCLTEKVGDERSASSFSRRARLVSVCLAEWYWSRCLELVT